MRKLIRKAAQSLGFDIIQHRYTDLSADDRAILRRVADYTMTSVARQIALIHAVRHLVRAGVPGCIVECGVWRGGSTMAAALALQQEGDTSRDIYLFDTFEGMSAPTDADKDWDGTLAQRRLQRERQGKGIWCYAPLEGVRANMASTNYPAEHVHFVKGPVEQTLPARAPDSPIALLRLDTDWYESTRHEMVHLFPLVGAGGVLIVDDYGYWQGARKAVDEYLAAQPGAHYLHRIDYTGRLLVKH